MNDESNSESLDQIPVRKPTILCIDDDANVTDALARRLHSFDITVSRAFHGTQGLKIATNTSPDLILTDLHMPGGTGDELIRQLKSNPSTAKIPVFVITGIQDDSVAEDLMQVGVTKVFKKPVEFNLLMDSICECLGINCGT